jgi:exosortase/archaeosortase family protein
MLTKPTLAKAWIIGGLLASTILAAWPQWAWMVRRSTDGSDDPWGIVALMTLVALVIAEKRHLSFPTNTALIMSAIGMILATFTWGWLPPIMSSALAVLVGAGLMASLLPKSKPLLPLLFLALLALPLVASLNFYLGYPLRWFCATCTSFLLSLFGTDVTASGASLWWNGKNILIDAPCAGIAMLWVGLYVSTLFSYLTNATTLRTLVNLVLAGALVVLGNVLRNFLLFYKESGLVPLPHWTHEAIGLLVFLFVVPCIYAVCHFNVNSKKRGVKYEA